jgi:hypothetical protein
MQTLTRSTAVLALAAALVAAPLDAQDRPAQQQQQEQCTATITPAQVQAGQAAQRLTVSVNRDVGEISRLQAADSGIVLAQARDLPRTDLAANAPAPRPIAMGEQRNTWTVYVNTQNARPGSHAMTFVGANGNCTAQIRVDGGAAQPGQQGRQGGAQPAQPGGRQGQPGAQPSRPPAGGQQPSGGAQPTQPPSDGPQPSTQPTQPGTQPRPNN